MTCEQFQERIAEMLEGTLSDAEAREWIAHRAACSTCQALWEAVIEIDARLRSVPMALPPPDLSIRISRRIRRRVGWEHWGAMLLSLAVGLGIAGLWAGSLWSLRGWLEELWRWIPRFGLAFRSLIHPPLVYLILMTLLGAVVVLALGLWASMKAIDRISHSRYSG